MTMGELKELKEMPDVNLVYFDESGFSLSAVVGYAWQRVGHRLPKAVMLEGHHLAAIRERYQRFTFPGRGGPLDQVQAPRRKHKETAVDHSPITTRFFNKA